MESIIKWQTEKPKESGSYLVTIKGRQYTLVTVSYYSLLDGWSCCDNVIAWRKLSEIEPYKE